MPWPAMTMLCMVSPVVGRLVGLVLVRVVRSRVHWCEFERCHGADTDRILGGGEICIPDLRGVEDEFALIVEVHEMGCGLFAESVSFAAGAVEFDVVHSCSLSVKVKRVAHPPQVPVVEVTGAEGRCDRSHETVCVASH